MEKEDSTKKNKLNSPTAAEQGNMPDIEMEKEGSIDKNSVIDPPDEVKEGNASHVQKEHDEKEKLNDLVHEKDGENAPDFQKDGGEKECSVQKNIMNSPTAENFEGGNVDVQKEVILEPDRNMKSSYVAGEGSKIVGEKRLDELNDKLDDDSKEMGSGIEGTSDKAEEIKGANDKVEEVKGTNENFKDIVIKNRLEELNDETDAGKEMFSGNEEGTNENRLDELNDKMDASEEIFFGNEEGTNEKVVEMKGTNENVEDIVNDNRLDELNDETDASKEMLSGNEKGTNENIDEIKGTSKNVEDMLESARNMKSSNAGGEGSDIVDEKRLDAMIDKIDYSKEISAGISEGTNETIEEQVEPIFDGTETPRMEANKHTPTHSLSLNPDRQGSWPGKAVALIRAKSAIAVSNVLRRLSGMASDDEGKDGNSDTTAKKVADSSNDRDAQEASQRTGEKSGWNPLGLIWMSQDVDAEKKSEQQEKAIEELLNPIAMKGRIILYTRLGCQDCREARLFLHRKKFRYAEINIDLYPSRKLELEKIAGSSDVPRVFFNEILIGGLSELKRLDESGKLAEKIDYVIAEVPPFEAPLPPLSGEDDMSTFGAIDELAIIVRKMKESIPVKDRFYKFRRFTNCFLGSEAVDFLSENQYLEREEAVEFGRKLANKLFFQHVLDENIFEDGNHLYRFLDHDSFVVYQCYNIPRGITDVKPKPIIEISSRLRFLSRAIFEAYTSEDGKHVDYRSIHGSEEFARYLRIIEELQRVELQDMPREEKLSFFINLFNMMAIHAILLWGHPAGALERRRFMGNFKYVIGGCTYSLSAIQNGILRGNQRPPYNLIRPFGMDDKRFNVTLPYPEPLIHFALVCGNRSEPALRCYSPENIGEELTEAAHNFFKSGGLIIDLNAKVALVSKILKWYSIDFGKTEAEVLKYSANYLDPADSEALLELLATAQLKVVYQPYDWGLNN